MSTSVLRACSSALLLTMATASAASAAGGVPVFTDESLARGVSYMVLDGSFGGTGQYGCGVALVDLDGDGDDDILGTGAAGGQVALFENDGAGQFTDRTATSGLAALLWVMRRSTSP